MTILSLDVGTTHCKAGLIEQDGTTLAIASRRMHHRYAPEGYAYYSPEELWETVLSTLEEVASAQPVRPISAVGITSMAETGLLLDRRIGVPRSPFLPWFDTSTTPQAEMIRRQADPQELFCKMGVWLNFKRSLAKILWLRQRDESITDGAIWLSVADYFVYRLTGAFATDYSLACRTYAFRLDHLAWDADWLARFGIRPDLFPPAHPSGAPVGEVATHEFSSLGLAKGTPVAISGHDHPCVAFGATAITGKRVIDSMGTAEALLGTLGVRTLGEKEYRSGLVFGRHVAQDQFYWMGGLSTSGGSIEWLRAILGNPPLSYTQMDALLAGASDQPGELLYFPYLSGSGSPHNDGAVRGAFIGLDASHGQADLLKAVLEGAAYEVELIRRAAEQINGSKITELIATGGGTRNHRWMQIKANVTGCRYIVPAIAEAGLLGAALAAGLGCGIYSSEAQAFGDVCAAHKHPPGLERPSCETFEPNPDHHWRYRQLYEKGYLPLQEPLRAYFR